MMRRVVVVMVGLLWAGCSGTSVEQDSGRVSDTGEEVSPEVAAEVIIKTDIQEMTGPIEISAETVDVI